MSKAKAILNSTQISTPHIILIHTGINLNDQRPKDITLNLKELPERFQNKFNCEVFVSGVIPRGEHYQNHAHKVNNRLKHQLSNSAVKLITHKNLNPSHGVVDITTAQIHSNKPDSGSVQFQTLLMMCRRFAMVRISDNAPAGNKAKRLSLVIYTAKKIYYHHHLRDDRDLRRNKKQGESTSGVQLLSKNLFEALTKKLLHLNSFDKILRYTPKTQFRLYKSTIY